MRTIVKFKPACICSSCGEHFSYKRHRGWFLKTLSPVVEIRKYYCCYCKKTYYVYIGMGTSVKADKNLVQNG